jgi:hypothetical protein
LLAVLTQCQTTGSGATTDAAAVACTAFAPIYWSARDTAKTVAQIKEHNAAWAALCRRRPDA